MHALGLLRSQAQVCLANALLEGQALRLDAVGPALGGALQRALGRQVEDDGARRHNPA